MNQDVAPVDHDDPDFVAVKIFTRIGKEYDLGNPILCDAAEIQSPDDFPAAMFTGIPVEGERAVISVWPNSFSPRHATTRGDRIVLPDSVCWVVMKVVSTMGGMRLDCACIRHFQLDRPG